MGLRGPKPKDKVSNTPLRGNPEPPPHLDKAARKHWRYIARLVDQAGLLSHLDCDALEVYCSLWSTWLEAEAQLATQSRVIEGPSGPKKNPWHEIAVQSVKDMKSFMDMFGLSPRARNGMKVAEQDQVEDKWSELESG